MAVEINVVPPTETRPAHMRPLAVLPVFLDLTGRRVVVAGDAQAAIWKAELAAAAGAAVEVYAPSPSDELVELAAEPPDGRVAVIRRAWRETDLAGAALAVGALAGNEAMMFAAAATRLRVPFNVVDRPDLSPVHFGAIVNRAPVAIGISTGGTAPVLGQMIRMKIETLLPPALGAWAAAAKRVRRQVLARIGYGVGRREIWHRYARKAFEARGGPTEDDIADLFEPARHTGGSVVLVGAGPGDPELLTLKAVRALQSADVVLYDRLVSPEILELARREAKRMLVGKIAGGARVRQDDINALMVGLAQHGRRVVRLKGGDPMVFGRAAEEITACRNAGVAVEVIPGITAALGAAAELLLPLSERGLAQRIQFIAGHSETGDIPDIDWASVADPATTTALYMARRNLREIVGKLRDAGAGPDLPLTIVTAATTSRMQSVRSTLSRAVTEVGELQGDDPCLLIAGRSATTSRSTPASSATGRPAHHADA
jgi:uroporphyrin-III C-methyltransferase/precorrin-2 dehydrogenase/sirohydrochlorin ferrochelatase